MRVRVAAAGGSRHLNRLQTPNGIATGRRCRQPQAWLERLLQTAFALFLSIFKLRTGRLLDQSPRLSIMPLHRSKALTRISRLIFLHL